MKRMEVSLKPVVLFTMSLSLLMAPRPLQAATISTGFNGADITTVSATVMFDLEVLSPGGITITGFEVNSLSLSLDGYVIYTKTGSHVGAEDNASLWTQVATGTGTGAGLDTPSPLVLSNPILLSSGPHALAFHSPGITQRVFDGMFPVSNADVSLTFGLLKTDLFSGGTTSNLTWSGTIIYNPNPLNSLPEPSTALLVGLTAMVAGGVGLVGRRRMGSPRAT